MSHGSGYITQRLTSEYYLGGRSYRLGMASLHVFEVHSTESCSKDKKCLCHRFVFRVRFSLVLGTEARPLQEREACASTLSDTPLPPP